MQDSPSPYASAAVSAAPPVKKRKRNPLVTIIVLVLIVAAVGGAIWLANQPKAPAPGGPGGPGGPGRGGPGGGRGRPSTTVGIATAAQANVPITIDSLGTVTPAATVTVTPQVSGVITQILYKEGQTVQKGQTLAVIDPRPFQMVLNQAQGALVRDQAQLSNAKLQLDRDKTLLTQDSIARQDVDTQDALVRQLQGTVVTDQAAVGSAQLNLGFSRVIAPVSGKVGLRPVDLGNFIAAGTTTGVAVITQVTPIDVEFTIPQVDLPRVQTNAENCPLGVAAYDQSKTVLLDSGVFSTLDNRIDTTTGTVKAKARFPNAKATLFPNQFVNVRLNLDVLRNVVTVPVTAVRTGPQGDFVWVLQPNKTVKLRTVTRGPATVDSTSITKGLDAGEQVITEGGDRLTEGARVQLPGDRPIPPGGRRGGRGRRGGAAGAAGAGGAAAGGVGQAAGGADASADASGATPGAGRGRRGGFGQGASAGAGTGADAGGGDAQGAAAGGFAGRRGGMGQGAGGFAGRGQGAGGFAGRGGAGGRRGGKAMSSGCAPLAGGMGRGGMAGGRGQGRGGMGGQGMPGGRHGQGGDNTALPAQSGQAQGPGRGRGGRGGQRDDSTPAGDTTGQAAQPRRHRPTDQTGQSPGGGQGGGQSNGG